MFRAAETTGSRPPTTYRLETSRFAEYRRELLIRMGVVVPLLLAGLLYLAWQLDKERSLFRLVYIPVLIGWILSRQFKDQRDKWETLVLEFQDGKLIRRLDGYPVLELLPGDVKAIREFTHGIIIETNSRLTKLFISNRLSNYQAFRTQLNSWAPSARLAVWSASSWDYLRNVSEVLICACIFGGPLYLTYTSRQTLIVPLGIVLSVSMLAFILYFRNSPNIAISSRKGLWFLLLLPILAMYMRLR